MLQYGSRLRTTSHATDVERTKYTRCEPCLDPAPSPFYRYLQERPRELVNRPGQTMSRSSARRSTFIVHLLHWGFFRFSVPVNHLLICSNLCVVGDSQNLALAEMDVLPTRGLSERKVTAELIYVFPFVKRVALEMESSQGNHLILVHVAPREFGWCKNWSPCF